MFAGALAPSLSAVKVGAICHLSFGKTGDLISISRGTVRTLEAGRG
jgi:hypothetical protein